TFTLNRSSRPSCSRQQREWYPQDHRDQQGSPPKGIEWYHPPRSIQHWSIGTEHQ
ncbi:hypothetical protein EV175_005099, partial [Coemansia sp. RSA 1933]